MKTLFKQIAFAAVVFAAGFAAGFFAHGSSALKQEIKEVQAVRQTDAASVQKAQQTSIKVEGKVAQIASNIDANKSQIHDRVSAQIKHHAAATAPHSTFDPTEYHDETTSSGASRCGGFALDVGTVRMLNASRQGAAFDRAGGLDEAGDAAPALCFTDFIDADQDLTKLYLDLSERHNSLVQSVEDYQADQRKRLGIKDDPEATETPAQ